MEIEEANRPKRGTKRKGKGGPSEVVKTSKKKLKKQARKPKSPSPVVEEYSDSHIVSDIRRTKHG